MLKSEMYAMQDMVSKKKDYEISNKYCSYIFAKVINIQEYSSIHFGKVVLPNNVKSGNFQ